jgi:plasmid stabilization system protein ParE
MKPCRVISECETKVMEAADYIKKDSPKEAVNFYNAWEKSLGIIGFMPGLGTKHKNGVRKILLGKFRYYIYYKEYPDRVDIITIRHTSMKPE